MNNEAKSFYANSSAMGGKGAVSHQDADGYSCFALSPGVALI